jgi:hypothetical protein
LRGPFVDVDVVVLGHVFGEMLTECSPEQRVAARACNAGNGAAVSTIRT